MKSRYIRGGQIQVGDEVAFLTDAVILKVTAVEHLGYSSLTGENSTVLGGERLLADNTTKPTKMDCGTDWPWVLLVDRKESP